MPDLWMDVDAALAEVPVNIMPLIDDGDFKTRETGIVFNQAGMDLVWNFVTPAGATTQTAVTPTAAGDYDWAHQGDGMYSIEIPAVGGASINNNTEGFGWFTGFCTGVLPWRGPIIGFRAAGLNNLLIESAFSATRGLAGTALPNAAADAAAGLPVSDLGGLDLDTLLTRLDAAISTRSSHNAAAIWAVAVRDLTALGFNLANTDFAAGAIDANAIAAAAITAAEAPNLDAAVSSRSSHTAAAVWAVGARTLTGLGFNLDTADFAANFLTAALIANGAIDAATFAAGAIDAAAIANAAIDAATFAAGAINAAAIAAAAITAVEAPNLDAAVSSRSSHAAAAIWAVGARTLTGLGFNLGTADFDANFLTAALIANGAIDAATFAAGAIDAAAVANAAIDAATFAAGALNAAALATDAAEEIADALIGRNIAGGSNVGRLVSDAFAILRNRRRIVAGIMTVYQADDATPLWTAGVTTAPGNPVTDIDPV